MPTKKTRKVKGWAVVIDDFIPDLNVGNPVGNIYYICSFKSDADNFVKEMNDPITKVIPCTITYSLPLPKKSKKNK